MLVIEIIKRENESLVEYHKRIINGKLVDKTLSDYDYTELSELLYGRKYASDVARRMMYGSRKTIELFESENFGLLSDSALLKNIRKEKEELIKEKQRVFDQRREYKKLLSETGRLEHLYDSLSDAANNLCNSVGKLYNEDKTEQVVIDNETDNEAILVFCDWHYGMTTKNIFNEYNTEICKKRVGKVVDYAIKRMLLHQCKKLHIVVLGDVVHGGIHVSARVASEELVCAQLMQVSEILAQSIEKLSRYANETKVYFTYGNHARTIQNKNDSTHRDNMERLVPWWIKERLNSYENIRVADESENEFVLIEACGRNFCATHGDLDSVKSSPRLLSTLFHRVYNKDIDYILLADKHHHESFGELGVTAIICGALCGSDDYASEKRLFSTPEQLMLIVNQVDGVDAEYRINCN